MSFNVYTGVKFRTNNLEEALGQLKSIRPKALRNMALSLEGRNFEGLVEKMDKYLIECLRDYKIGKIKEKLAVKIAIVRNASRIGDRIDDLRERWALDYPFHIMIYPYKGKLYGNYFGGDYGDNEELLKTVVDNYWWGNSGDPDPEVPKREWNQRGKVWNGIFEDFSSPIQIGVLFYIAKWEWIDYNDIPDSLVDELADLDIVKKAIEELNTKK